MSDSAACPGCESFYGVLVCRGEAGHPGLHHDTLASGRVVRWGTDCDGTCTADCGQCKGVLRSLAGVDR